MKRVAELSHSGGFTFPDALTVPIVAVYSDGTVVFNGQKRLTLTPGALDLLVGTLQKDLKGQPGGVMLPKGGHANPDQPSTVVGVLQPGGTYQSVSAMGLAEDTESKFPAPVSDAFAKVQALTSDATTPYTSTWIRYSLQCPSGGNTPAKPWPAGVPQPGMGTQKNCMESHSADGATAAAVRAACFDTDTPPARPQPPSATVYHSDKGPRICRWRLALPEEAS